MKITNLKEKTLATVEVDGDNVKITFAGKTKEIDIAEYQEDNVKNIDIVEENGDWGIGKVGIGCRYIASIIIPAKEYKMIDTGSKDLEGNPVFERVQMENLEKTEIRLY